MSSQVKAPILQQIVNTAFPSLSNIDKKRLMLMAVKIEQKYMSPHITAGDLIHDLYLSIKEERRKNKNQKDEFEFLVSSLNSISRNIIVKSQNKTISLDLDLHNKPDDNETREEIILALEKLLIFFKNKHNELFPMAKAIFEAKMNKNEISKLFDIPYKDVEIAHKKVITIYDSFVKNIKN